MAWSPEGTALAYTAENADSGRRLMTLDLRTGARARQPGQVGLELDWGHQGIIVQRPGNHGLLRRRADSAGPGDFGAAETATTVYGPRSSPDGKSVAVLAYQGGTGPVTLSLIRSGDSAMRGLLAGAYRPVGWSADGQLVYAAKNTFAPTPEALMAVPVGGGSPRVVARLPAGFRSEDITSDGRLLVVTEVKSRSDTWQIDLPPPR